MIFHKISPRTHHNYLSQNHCRLGNKVIIFWQVVLLECLRKETMLPKDVLSHFNTAFAYAKQGRC